MRTGIVVVGVVLLIIGAVLMFVPLSPQASQKVQSGSSTPFALLQVSGFSITGSVPVSFSWSSPSTVTVVGVACSGTCATTGFSSISGAVVQLGTSGTFTLNQPNGGQILLAAISSGNSSSAPTVTFNPTTALSLVGSILLIVGIVILIVGVVLKSKKAKAAAMPARAPAAPMDQTMEPASEPPAGSS